MDLEIITQKEDKREDAFWYRGEDLARVQFPNGKKLYVYATGEIRIQFEQDGTFYKGDQAVDKARELELSDEDLNEIGDEFDGWDMNNWFTVNEFDIDGNCISDDLGICHTYDEAIKMLEVVSGEKQKEYYS